jgi:hypothetical protein
MVPLPSWHCFIKVLSIPFRLSRPRNRRYGTSCMIPCLSWAGMACMFFYTGLFHHVTDDDLKSRAWPAVYQPSSFFGRRVISTLSCLRVHFKGNRQELLGSSRYIRFVANNIQINSCIVEVCPSCRFSSVVFIDNVTTILVHASALPSMIVFKCLADVSSSTM